MDKVCLFRYDMDYNTGWDTKDTCHGFLECLYEVHTKHEIPVTIFCTGRSLETMEPEYKAFWAKAKGNKLFDMQNHSYAHIGLRRSYTREPADTLVDYRKSFDIQERVLGERPWGISFCGTSWDDGLMYPDFDFNDRTRAEFAGLAQLGVKMLNTTKLGADGEHQFCHYGYMGHPEIMGFPSGYADTAWLATVDYDRAMSTIMEALEVEAKRGHHFPVMLHDFVAWVNYTEIPRNLRSKKLEYTIRIADRARRLGYTLLTHADCYRTPELWK